MEIDTYSKASDNNLFFFAFCNGFYRFKEQIHVFNTNSRRFKIILRKKSFFFFFAKKILLNRDNVMVDTGKSL